MLARVSPNHLAAALMEDEGIRKASGAALERLELETKDHLAGESLEGTFRKMLRRRWLIEALAWTGVSAEELRARTSGPRGAAFMKDHFSRFARAPQSLDDGVLILALKDEAAGTWLASIGVPRHPLMMRLTHERLEPDGLPIPAASETEEIVVFDDPYTEGSLLLMVLEQAFELTKDEGVRHVMRLIEAGRAVLGAWPTRIARRRVKMARALAASLNVPIRIEVSTVSGNDSGR